MRVILQFLGELKRERTRMFLTVLGIAWGTASIVLMLSVGQGVIEGARRGMQGMGKAIVVVWGGETSKPYRGLKPGRKVRLREEDARLLREKVKGIGSISPEYIRWGVYVSSGKRSMNTRTVGVWPEYGPLRNICPQEGRFLNQLDLRFKRRVVFLGDEVARRLFGSDDPVGKVVHIDRVPFTVIGVMKKKLQTSSYSGMDKDATFIPASTFRVMFGHRYVNDIVYRPDDISQAELVKAEVYRVMAWKYRFDPEDRQTLRMWDTIEGERAFGRVALGVQMFLGIIGGLSLLVAGVGLANIMYAVVRGRTREIGIRMAVGARPRDIIYEYLLHSALTVLAGGVIGFGLSWALVEFINALPLKGEVFKYLGRPVMSATTAIVASVVLGVVALTAGIFPAKRAASIDPAEALRYE